MTQTDPRFSKTLAAIVVAYRSLGLQKDLARKAMEELHRRKESGDIFDFESYIQEKVSEVPQPDINPKVMSLISSLARNK
jgi:hypothetical protein